MYELLCASARGSSHVKEDTPCQDYGMVYETEGCKIFVVADGHGDGDCPRSNYGSQKACEIAVKELEQFFKDIKKEGWESKLLKMGKGYNSIIRQLITSIIANWSATVNEDYENNPLTELERAKCKNYTERYDKGERIEHAYGTTIIAGLMTEDYLLLIQQGDGRCDVFDAKGIVSMPIPWDDKCFANVTTSMCDVDAIQRCRFHVVDMKRNPVIAVMAGSDGVEDSFLTLEQMHTFYREKLEFASEHSVTELKEELENLLPEFSLKGSGDDVTICGIIDSERVKECIPTFHRENEIADLESQIKVIDDRLSSLTTSMGEKKTQSLKEKSDSLIAEYNRLEEKVESLATEYDETKQRITDEDSDSFNIIRDIQNKLSSRSAKLALKLLELQEEIDATKENLEDVSIEKDNAGTEYESRIEMRQQFEKEKAEAEARLEELKAESY